MDCLVQSSESASGSPSTAVEKDTAERVTFLYHLCDGCSPKSYGVNVARLAGLPAEVLALAVQKSAAFLDSSSSRHSENGDFSSASTYYRYFDRILSLLSSDMTDDELTCVARELWQRFKHEMSRKVSVDDL
jgi:DNA mismatch repair ATPase MutS